MQKKNLCAVYPEMGVLKWLRRERVTLTSHRNLSPTEVEANRSQSEDAVGTIRTEEYKRDLAEFQARRLSGTRELPALPDTPVKKRCGRHSLPVSCTDCTSDHDKTFNIEKKSANKYKKKTHKRTKSASENNDCLPNIQFLFQNQVFMPGNVFEHANYSEPCKNKRYSRVNKLERQSYTRRYIDYEEREDEVDTPTPLLYKNNSLPFDVGNFLEGGTSGDDEAAKYAEVVAPSSQSSTDDVNNDTCGAKLLEVMDELKSFDQWADQQLQVHSANSSKIEDKSDRSAYGLPVVSSSDLDVTIDRTKTWSFGTWGVVPVQMKKLTGITLEHVKKKQNTEINVLRKCRHPNVILLMAVYPVQDSLYLVCESCVDSLFGILHIQGRILSAQTAAQYACDIINALVFLRMRGYIHTELNSHSIMINSRDTAKLADCGPCESLPERSDDERRSYVETQPRYVNIGEVQPSSSNLDCDPLLSRHSSEVYLQNETVMKPYNTYRNSLYYRWHAPELFEDDNGYVRPCSRSDVYSLSLVLWESCNASIPWKSLTYDALRDQYVSWRGGIRLKTDGRYPGCLLAVLRDGLTVDRRNRPTLMQFARTMEKVKKSLDNMEYIVIPARMSKKGSDFDSVGWDASPTDSDTQSPTTNYKHHAVIHKPEESGTESDKESKSDHSPLYETVSKGRLLTPQKCFIADDEPDEVQAVYAKIKEMGSACSTPIKKLRAKIKNISTSDFHRSDSTEYCSLISPGHKTSSIEVDENFGEERPNAKLSRSFTPKSYIPLHIKVPDIDVERLKALPKNQVRGKPSYHFNIRNYSLPTTPIARSNKLRKNAWLSGELNEDDEEEVPCVPRAQSAPETPAASVISSADKETCTDDLTPRNSLTDQNSPESFTALRRSDQQQEFHSTVESRDHSNSWSFRTTEVSPRPKKNSTEDVVTTVGVKPLVAIHEKWIYEANKKTCRSMSLPEDNRFQISALKPASHSETLQKSFPVLNKKPGGVFRSYSMINDTRAGSRSEQFMCARDTLASCLERRYQLPRKSSTLPSSTKATVSKVDQTTDTSGIEDYIRDLIRKEIQNLTNDTTKDKGIRDDILNKGVNNIIETLRNGFNADNPINDATSKDTTESLKSDERKDFKPSFSRVKINGNNKPLLQITFSRNGENSLQILDNCVNVTVSDSNKDRLNQSAEEGDDSHHHSLKRCQTFSAIQEARSTEDLYIDDDLSVHMQENFGGRVAVIPLHGSLHEILCEKEDDCCLIKVKQENGCDSIYFRCDNSDTESRDQTDGRDLPQDTVIYKRSISLVEERIQRVYPKDKRSNRSPVVQKRSVVVEPKQRPKSDIVVNELRRESRFLSSSSPSLATRKDDDEVELNIDNVMCYQDSSSDECLMCQAEDDFEALEREIELDVANSKTVCGCLEKISEENLSAVEEDVSDDGNVIKH